MSVKCLVKGMATTCTVNDGKLSIKINENYKVD